MMKKRLDFGLHEKISYRSIIYVDFSLIIRRKYWIVHIFNTEKL